MLITVTTLLFSMSFCVNLIVINYYAAALRVMSYLPLPCSSLSCLKVIPTPMYDYIAKNRCERFGKARDCLVLQAKELLQHFINSDEMMNRDS